MATVGRGALTPTQLYIKQKSDYTIQHKYKSKPQGAVATAPLLCTPKTFDNLIQFFLT